MSNLMDHAKRELALSGVDNDIYGDMASKAVLELIEVFSKQGHSGMSASLVTSLFTRLAEFKNLTPLTDDINDWEQQGDHLWQNRRNSEAFSKDGGKTYYLLSEVEKIKREDRLPYPLHTAVSAAVTPLVKEK